MPHSAAAPPSDWPTVRRLLVVRLDNLGDVVMTGPALRTLRRAFPAAGITFMVSPLGSQVCPLLPWVDKVIVHRSLWQDVAGTLPLDPLREWKVVQMIRSHRFDAVVIFTSFSQSPYPSAYACYLAGVPIRLGQSAEFGGGVLSPWVKPLPVETHQVDRNLFLLESAGFAVAGRRLELAVSEAAQRQADRLLQRQGIAPEAPFMALAPGASCPARMYDLDRYAEVARLLTGATGLPMVLLGSPREMPLAEPILRATGGHRVVSLIGRTSVPELAALIRRARLLIGGHSGPLHLAEAFRCPMVILFSGTDLASQWAPRETPAKLLRRAMDCAPCYRSRCSLQMECLDIPPAEVAGEALALLQDVGRQVA